MKEFDLEKAKQGNPVITRDGRKVRIICYDRVDPKRRGNIIALVLGGKGVYEQIIQYDLNGRQIDFASNCDLLLDD